MLAATDTAESDRILRAYAVRTGIRASGASGTRYLWTDAYAVLTLCALHRTTGDGKHLQRAITLAHLVHQVLGRHREDDTRVGWISGLDEADGARRPTAGGLRIGKPLPERREGEPLDDRAEWERDGQYFHYLTKWMHALCALALSTGDAAWSAHAVELAQAAVRGFVRPSRAGEPPRIAWKMSIDLSRPLVSTSGQHDALDGLAAIAFVRATHHRVARAPAQLDHCIDTMRRCCAEGAVWGTPDALGIGGLLSATATIAGLTAEGELAFDGMLHTLLADAHRSLDFLSETRTFSAPIESRLAFRELGLAIGLDAVGPMLVDIRRHPDRFGNAASARALAERIESLSRHAPLARTICATWRHPTAQASRSWRAHEDINAVMLAACLA